MKKFISTGFLLVSFLILSGSCKDRIQEKIINTTDTLIYGTIDRVLIIGNSITKAKPIPEESWYGDWGMAASDSTNDYVHVLMDSIRKRNPFAEFRVTGKGVVFEREFMDYDLAREYKEFRVFNPELIIIRLGENVNDSLAGASNFEGYFEEFVEYFRYSERVPVVCVSSFWKRPNTTRKMQMVSEENGYIYMELDDLYQDLDNAAFSKYGETGIGSHPSDLGMQRIAARIWSKTRVFFK